MSHGLAARFCARGYTLLVMPSCRLYTSQTHEWALLQVSLGVFRISNEGAFQFSATFPLPLLSTQ